MKGGGGTFRPTLGTFTRKGGPRDERYGDRSNLLRGSAWRLLAEVSGQQGRAVMDGYVAAPLPSLAVPLLAGAAGEAVDSSSLRFLVAAALRKLKEEEVKLSVK